jgi:hypothetical protein
MTISILVQIINYYFIFFLHLKALYFQTGFSQEHRGRHDIKESNLMQHKAQQQSNSIFIKKHFLSVNVHTP